MARSHAASNPADRHFKAEPLHASARSGTASESHTVRLERIRRLARLMDESFTVPGTNYRFGLDGLIGLIPGIGDVVTTGFSAYIISEAAKMGVPKRKLARMATYVALDLLAGSIPVIGDVFDFAYKANKKNVELLNRHFEVK